MKTSSGRRPFLLGLAAALATTSAVAASVGSASAASQLVISEIMYNPASAEDDWEWVEVHNPDSTDVDLTGFVIDDQNSVALGSANIAGGSVPAGGTAVLYNSDDVSAADFEAAWGTGINLVPVTSWSAMGLNNGGDSVAIWADFASYSGDNQTQTNAIVRVPFDDSAPWPSDDGAGSIFLTDLTADESDGSNWELSTDGAATPAGGAAYTSFAGGGNSGADIGSPGGTIVIPTPTARTIPEIQGAQHVSPFLGDLVETTGIVTAVDTNGFYVQDPVGDSDIATSDAIFVFTGSNPGLAVGDEVTVTGTVSEFTPGGASTNNLSTSQISGATVSVVSSGNALPAPVVIGTGGRIPPTEVIDDDAFGSFDPATDGLDFYESLEAMLVTVAAPTAVAGTTRFGEIFAVPDGVTPTGLSDRGTLNISPDDYNPERVQIDEDSGIFNFDFPFVDTGATFGDITGVVGYSFGNFEVYPTADIGAAVPGTLEPEVSSLERAPDQLTVASYNVLNLDPNDADGDEDVADGRFDAIAAQVVGALNSPDVIALQEIQDDNGTDGAGVTSAAITLQTLVDAIVAAGGPTYEFIDNEFIGYDTSGGQPIGNIRTAFLYDPTRVTPVGDPDTVVDPLDQQVNPANPFFDTRLPLVQTFEFFGDEVTVVNNHFSSKGGSSPLFGTEQNSTDRQEDVVVNGSLDERQAQAAAVDAYVDGILDADASAKVIVLGDFNEFEYISPLLTLSDRLTNLTFDLAPDERYTFIFQGNSQSLDHVLVSDSLAATAEFDAVHVNVEFAETPSRASDHDPLLARFTFDPVVIDGDLSGRGPLTIEPFEVVTGDVTVRNGTLEVLGTIQGDVRQTGSGDVVVIGGTVGGDVDERGSGGVTVEDGTVGGDVDERGSGGVAIIAGEVDGDVDERGRGDVEILAASEVTGDVCERGQGTVIVSDDSSVGGEIDC